jgi:hypothetical protein
MSHQLPPGKINFGTGKRQHSACKTLSIPSPIVPIRPCRNDNNPRETFVIHAILAVCS